MAKTEKKRRPFNEPVTYEGETKTLLAWSQASALGNQPSVLRDRLDLGWTLGKALDTPVRPQAKSGASKGRKRIVPGGSVSYTTLYEIEGETKSLSAWAHYTGKNTKTVFDRIVAQGMSIEEALTKPITYGRSRTKESRMSVNNVKTPTDSTGIPPAVTAPVPPTVAAPISFASAAPSVSGPGWFSGRRPLPGQPQEPTTTNTAPLPPPPPAQKTAPAGQKPVPPSDGVWRATTLLTYEGETHTLREWALIWKQDEALVIGRLRSGWSMARLLTTPHTNQARLVTESPVLSRLQTNDVVVFGGDQRTVTDWAVFLRRTTNDLRRRLRTMPLAQALVRKHPWALGEVLAFRGEEHTVKAWAVKQDLPPETLRWRLDSGWSPERALLAPLRERPRNGAPQQPGPLVAAVTAQAALVFDLPPSTAKTVVSAEMPPTPRRPLPPPPPEGQRVSDAFANLKQEFMATKKQLDVTAFFGGIAEASRAMGLLVSRTPKGLYLCTEDEPVISQFLSALAKHDNAPR